jgi:hypothetical protein
MSTQWVWLLVSLFFIHGTYANTSDAGPTSFLYSKEVPTSTPTPFPRPIVAIDLDRDQLGIQSVLDYNTRYKDPIRGAVLVLGNPSDQVKDYAFEVIVQKSSCGDSINCVSSRMAGGEVNRAFERTDTCEPRLFRQIRFGVVPGVSLGPDESLTFFEFDMAPICKPGDVFHLGFGMEPINSHGFAYDAFINYSGVFHYFNRNPLETLGATIYYGEYHTLPTPSPTPTITRTPTITPTPTNTPLIPQRVVIDLDRNLGGIQSILTYDLQSIEAIQGSVVVLGAPTDFISDYSITVLIERENGEDSIDCEKSQMFDGEITSSFASERCSPDFLSKTFIFVNQPVILGDDGQVICFTFDVRLFGQPGENIELVIASTNWNASLQVEFNGIFRTFGDGSQEPITTEGAIVECVGLPVPTQTPTPFPTFTPAPPCDDSGYFILDAYGGRHVVGNPPSITGPLYYGREVARDLEIRETDGGLDLAVLDRFGAVQFVQNPKQTPTQMFYWPEGTEPPNGPAVDLVLSRDGEGYWVLTENGGIYRAGSTLLSSEDSLLGNAAGELTQVLGIPFGGEVPRDPSLPQHDNASIRAVSLVVVQSKDPISPDGYVVIDSQGGHYIFDCAGNLLDDDEPGSLLNAGGGSGATVYPFFKGLDIARDLEPTAGEYAAILLDGWGGVHPIPVEFGRYIPVAFIRNEPPARVYVVGLPYIQTGFDNPSTEEDESDPDLYGIDANSIFRDLEFCSTGNGVYVLDAFGAVFAFGNTRSDPHSLTPRPGLVPYFFPNLFALDMEAAGETSF